MPLRSRESINYSLQWFLCLLITVHNTSGFSYPSVSCDFNETDNNCRDKFYEMAIIPSTKAIYIHIHIANVTVKDTAYQSILNPIIEWIWVNESSIYFLEYPDDFHQLTFGLLADNIYQFSIRLNERNGYFKNWNDTLYFIYFSVLANVSIQGRLCHRETTTTQTLDFINRNIAWIGYNYECINLTPDSLEITYLSKLTATMKIIIILCTFFMTWFPLFFAITDQNKSHTNQNDSKNSNLNRIETNYLTRYDRGDVPYGIQRFILTCFSSYPYLQVSQDLRTSSKRSIIFASFKLALVSTIVLWFLDYFVISNYENRNIPPDISGYSDLYALPFEVLSSVVGYTYFLGILSFLTLFSLDEFTYCLDIRSTSIVFLRKLHFRRFICEGVERNIPHNLINRLSLLIKWRFWYSVAKISFRPASKHIKITQKYRKLVKKLVKILVKILIFLSCIFIFISNILFMVVISFIPLSWTLLSMCMYYQDRYATMNKTLMKFPICNLMFPIRLLLTMVVIALTVSQYIVMFLALQYNSSPLAAIAKIVKTFCYLLLITVPQLSPFNFREMLFALAVVSYLGQHARHFLLLYKSLLETIFSIHETKENIINSDCKETIPKEHANNATTDTIHSEKEKSLDNRRKISKEHVDIEEFDYVVTFTFPLRIELFYFLLKFCLTMAFVLISLITLTGYTKFLDTDDSQLNNILSFSLILISPVLWELVCNTSPENKVNAQRHIIEQKVEEYFQNEQKSKRYCEFHVSKTWVRSLFSFCFNCFHYDSKGKFYREYKSWQMDETDSDDDDDNDDDDDDDGENDQSERRDETDVKKPILPRSTTIQQQRSYSALVKSLDLD